MLLLCSFCAMKQLMRLKGTDPEAFNTYVQMAADAANLASEQPEIFKALMQDKGLDPHLSDGETIGIHNF